MALAFGCGRGAWTLSARGWAPVCGCGRTRLPTPTGAPGVYARRRRAAVVVPSMGLFDSLKSSISSTLSDLNQTAPKQGAGIDHEAYLADLQKLVDRVNALEDQVESLSDEQMRESVQKLRTALEALPSDQRPDDEDLCMSFALVREASFRVLGLRHYDVQILAGFSLLDGKVAEMATGEGKTLVAALPVFVNALTGRGAHVVTVNDYLAERDARLIGKIHRFLGLSVGLVTATKTTDQRREAYNCDLTYVTNSELGFDFLRDNLALSSKDLVLQRSFNFAVVDECDSILIDEARTPLIISGPVDASTAKYTNAAKIAAYLEKGKHYTVSEKDQMVSLTEQGYSDCEGILKVDDLLNPSDPWAPYITNALKAKALFDKDVNYIVKGKEILIVDEFTGRVMEGRRWGGGLHQSVEAKEGLPVSSETQTNASISYQSFFRLFPTLGGMTGTAGTERQEFWDIYNLDVVAIPTALPIARKDYPDAVFRSQEGKFRAVMREIARVHPTGQPILIGTTSVESSEALSQLLRDVEVPHEVLNAKPESVQRESEIVAQAGRQYAITIATNMAGRGTDILLGGNTSYFAQRKVVIQLFKEIGPPFKIEEPEWPCDISEDATALINDAKDDVQKLLGKEDATLKSIEEAVDAAAEAGREDLESVSAALTKVKTEFDAELGPEKEEVLESGGLYVMGTARHESRRIDNQLRGRSGRQGDPGSSRFFLALDDNLFRVFGGDKVGGILNAFRVDEDTPIENQLVTNTLNGAQQNVEEYYADIRKRLFEFDEIMTTQRTALYRERRTFVAAERDALESKMLEYCLTTLGEITPGYLSNSADYEGLSVKLGQFFNGISDVSAGDLDKVGPKGLEKYLEEKVSDVLKSKLASLENKQDDFSAEIVRYVVLTQVDKLWVSHMRNMDFLKESVILRTYENVKPLDAYQEEGLELFKGMLDSIRRNSVFSLFMYETPKTAKKAGTQKGSKKSAGKKGKK